MISLNRFAGWAVIWWTCAEPLWIEWTPAYDAISALLAKRAWRVRFGNFVPRLLLCLFDRLRVMYAEPKRLPDGPVSTWSFHILAGGTVFVWLFGGS